MLYEDDLISAALAPKPNTKGHTKVILKRNHSRLLCLDDRDLLRVMLSVKRIADALRRNFEVQRCAFITTGDAVMSIIPLHGLGAEWRPIVTQAKIFFDTYPGYISSQDGPEMSTNLLKEICSKVQESSDIQEPFDHTFFGLGEDQNLFARIVRGESTQYRIWEDSEHIAFLTPFGNTVGFTVLVPRKHLSSDILGLDDRDYEKLMLAAKRVSEVLTTALNVDRCGLIFEGFEIDYAHVKLIPIQDGQPVGNSPTSTPPTARIFHGQYLGYVTSLDGPGHSDACEVEMSCDKIMKNLEPSISAEDSR